MKHRLTSLLVVGSVVMMAAGCGADAPPHEPGELRVGQGTQEIQGGYFDDFDKHAVGLVHLSNSSFGMCSGTLIAPNVVLTAQHCVAPTSGGGSVQCGSTVFGVTYPASTLYVTTRAQFTQEASNYHTVREVHLPGGPDFCGNDQAILILNDVVEASEAVPATPRVDVPLNPGEEYYAVGYGAQFDSNNAPSGVRQRRDGLFTECIGQGCNAFSIYPTEWLGDTGVCSGDSGGPAFDLLNRVVGVASRGGQGCSFPVYGDTYGWGQWIKDTTIHAAGLAGIEAPSWAHGWPTDPAYNHPVGGACTQTADCPSGVCLGGVCSRQCAENAPCPEGFECSVEGWCAQLPAPEPDPGTNNNEESTGGKKKNKGASSESVSGCTVAAAGTNAGATSNDPTKPIPWKWGVLMAGLAWMVRRRND